MFNKQDLFPTRRTNTIPSLFKDSFVSNMDETFHWILKDFFSDNTRIKDVFKNQSTYPKTDVVETDNGFVFNLAIPGLQKEDIQVLFDKGILTVKYEKSVKTEENDKLLIRELRHSSFQRSWEIGEPIKPEEISAKMENGILSINVPFVEPKKPIEEPKKIMIQ